MSFLKYSFQTGVTRFFLMFVGMISGVIHARWLGPSGLGIFALLQIVQGFAFRVGNLGFGSSFAFFVAKKKIRSGLAIKYAWGIGLAMSAVMVLILCLTWRWKTSPWHDIAPELFYLALPTVPIFFINNYLRRILSGQLRITVVNVSQLISTIIYLPLMIVYVVVLDMGVMGAVLAMVISQYSISIFLAIALLRNKDKVTVEQQPTSNDHVTVMSLWRYGRWNYLVMFVNFILDELPLFFLTYFHSKAAVGFFSVARNLSRRPRLVIQPFSKMLFPFTAVSHKIDATRRTNMLCRNTIPAMLLLAGLLAIVAKPLIVLLFGKEFEHVASVFYAIMPAIVFYPLTQFLGVHIAASGNPKLVFFTSILAVITAVVLCPILIPALGGIGAAITVSCVYATLAIVRVGVYLRFTSTKLTDLLIVKRSDMRIYKSQGKIIVGSIVQKLGTIICKISTKGDKS